MTMRHFLLAAAVCLCTIAIFRGCTEAEAQEPTTQIFNGPFTSGNAGVISLSPTWTAPSDLSIAASAFTPPRKIILQKSKDCKLVVLEDTAEKIILGCRVELSR